MKKSTILILLIVFLGSVLIVGVFGMDSIPFESIVYIQGINPTSVVTSDGQHIEIKQNSRGEYYAIIDYKPIIREGVEVFEVSVSYNLEPTDCTNKNLKVAIVYPTTELPCDALPEDMSAWRGTLVFHRAGSVHLKYMALDSSTGAEMDIWLYVVER